MFETVALTSRIGWESSFVVAELLVLLLSAVAAALDADVFVPVATFTVVAFSALALPWLELALDVDDELTSAASPLADELALTASLLADKLVLTAPTAELGTADMVSAWAVEVLKIPPVVIAKVARAATHHCLPLLYILKCFFISIFSSVYSQRNYKTRIILTS